MLTQIKADELRESIRQHDHLYYSRHQPAITDAEYDAMFAQLKEYERLHPEQTPPDSPTQKVAGTASPSFAPVSHHPPMLSLDNVFNYSQFEQWHQRIARELSQSDFPMCVEYKIDGVAVTLDYRQLSLTVAATRGDGNVGEDITANARTIRNLPLRVINSHHLPYSEIQVRGEIYMPKSALAKLNETRSQQGLGPYANTRNAAAGAVRNHDPMEARRRQLALWVYDLAVPEATLPSHHSRMNAVADAGFPVEPHRYQCHTPESVRDCFDALLERRNQIDFDADGIVVKVDELALRNTLGRTGHAPRWAIAWKFPAERAVTTLREITISVGRFGKLTPVAVLEPVHVEGVTVQSASLHNEEDIQRKDIRVGDRVIVERAGGVIPQVVGPVDPDPERPTIPFSMPSNCPVCAQPVRRDPAEAAHWCDNTDCGNQPLAALKHFVSKDAMDIEGLGPKWCQLLIEHGLVRAPTDIYSVTAAQLLTLPRMGDKLARRLLANIEQSKDRPLHRVLYALGIYRLGHHVSEILADRYWSLDEVASLSYDELTSLPDVSDVIASSIRSGFRSPRVQSIIAGLKDAGVTLHQEKTTMTTETMPDATAADAMPWQGQVFVVTGKLADYTRDEAHAVIASLGGATASRVTKQTTVLVHGEKPGSKLSQAAKVNAEIWTEDQFLNELARYG